MLCPNNCGRKATIHPTLGIMYCKKCQDKHNSLLSPSQSVEIIPERIKAERVERGDSILQTHVKGELDKRWVDIYGAEAAKEHGFTDKQIKNAKYVSDNIRTKNNALTYYKNST
jgi:hypothetical protein